MNSIFSIQLIYTQGAEERGLFSVNLNKQSSYLNCYLKIITSNAYLISAIILHCSDMELGLYFIVGLHRLLNEVLHVYTRRL